MLEATEACDDPRLVWSLIPASTAFAGLCIGFRV